MAAEGSGPAPGSISVSDQARVGVIGPGDNTVNMVTPRREINWPVVVGSPPPLASAFQRRGSVAERMGQGDGVAELRQVLTGDGGVGKSQIAAGFFAAATADLRVWASAESRTAVITGYAEAAMRLDLADRQVGPEGLASAFVGFLAATTRSWLVVVDDLHEPADMPGLWPPRRGQLVVTTRRTDASLSGGGRTKIDVGVYSPAEARSYLEQRLSPKLDDLPDGVLDEAGGLAEDLGFLPLALAQAAAVIMDQAISCSDYRGLFADRTATLEDLFPPDADADEYGRTVAGTWTLAIDAADHLDPVGLARPLAWLVAVCDPAGAPEAVFTSETSRRFLVGRTGAGEEDLIAAPAARKAVRALDRLSLLNHDPKQGNPRAVRMHNITGRAILQTLSSDEIAEVVLVGADALLDVWPVIENNPVLSESLRANTAVLLSINADALWDNTSGAHPVLFRSGRSLSDAGLTASAAAYWDHMLMEALGRCGPDHPDTLASRNNLAYAYRSAGDLGRAIPLYEQTLPDRERVLGPDHPDTLASRNNLAGAYQSAGDLGRAIPLYEQTLTDRERVLGPDHPDTLASRNNLAYAYESAGDLGRAIPLYEQTLPDRE
ncbi:tetratricopeptide repeat protein, partial [Microlunatus panaciterrae]|uniref:tetratricopeptide repeat protein n=1 Tax=Microlunatus panaciterrae TaxID=400768 RepID=UPI0031D48EEC